MTVGNLSMSTVKLLVDEVKNIIPYITPFNVRF